MILHSAGKLPSQGRPRATPTAVLSFQLSASRGVVLAAFPAGERGQPLHKVHRKTCQKCKSEEMWKGAGGFWPSPTSWLLQAHYTDCSLLFTGPDLFSNLHEGTTRLPDCSQLQSGLSHGHPVALEACKKDYSSWEQIHPQGEVSYLDFEGPRSLTKWC